MHQSSLNPSHLCRHEKDTWLSYPLPLRLRPGTFYRLLAKQLHKLSHEEMLFVTGIWVLGGHGEKKPLCNTLTPARDATPRKVEFLLAYSLLPKCTLVNVCQRNYTDKASKQRPGPWPCSKCMSTGQLYCTAMLSPSLFFLSCICFFSTVKCISPRLSSS